MHYDNCTNTVIASQCHQYLVQPSEGKESWHFHDSPQRFNKSTVHLFRLSKNIFPLFFTGLRLSQLSTGIEVTWYEGRLSEMLRIVLRIAILLHYEQLLKVSQTICLRLCCCFLLTITHRFDCQPVHLSPMHSEKLNSTELRFSGELRWIFRCASGFTLTDV